MARQFTIVGLGEALLLEQAEGSKPAGLASLVATEAIRLGHRGIVISRIGQDGPADVLLEQLAAAGVDTSHIQSDPDLPTGRIIERQIGGPVARYLDSPAAFDNLQADFDLDDVAQEADAVVYGLLTRRSGQTRSEENRFLNACAAAVKMMDLTDPGLAPERGHALSGLEFADVAIVDRAALTFLDPGGADAPLADATRDLQRTMKLTLAIAIDATEEGQSLLAQNAEISASAVIPRGRAALAATTVALLDALLRGKDIETAIALAARVAGHADAHPDEKVPEEWLA